MHEKYFITPEHFSTRKRKYKSLHCQMLPSQHVSNNLNSNIFLNENECPTQKGAKYSTPQKSVHNKPLELTSLLL